MPSEANGDLLSERKESISFGTLYIDHQCTSKFCLSFLFDFIDDDCRIELGKPSGSSLPMNKKGTDEHL